MTLRRYIVRRALLLPPMLLGVTLLTFILSHAVPANPISAELTGAAGQPLAQRATSSM